MAYGLKIDNGNGKRVVDSDYTGVYYVGKQTLTSPGTVQVSGYNNSSVPPLVFLKLPTSSGQFASVTELSYQSGSAPGGAATVSVTMPNSNIVYAYAGPSPAGGITSTACAAQGGTTLHTGLGGCRFTGTMQVSTDTQVRGNYAINQDPAYASSGANNFDHSGVYNNQYQLNNPFSVTVNIPMTNGVVNTSGVTVANTGFGWSVNDYAYLGNDATYNHVGYPNTIGWYPFNTSTNRFYTAYGSHCTNCDNVDGTNMGFSDSNYLPKVTVNSIASGWTATLGGSFSDTVTAYYYGIGGVMPTTNEHGLVIKDSSGDVTFSSNNVPPVIRGVDNISFTNLKYSTSTGAVPTSHTVNCNENLSYPTTSTAVYSVPITPTTQHGISIAPLGGGAPPSLLQLMTGGMTGGLRFKTSGANVTGLSFESAQTSNSQSLAIDDCNSSGGYSGTMHVHSPFWNITSGNTNVTTTSGPVCSSNTVFTVPSWNVNSDCVFIDTTLPDTLNY